MPAGLVGWAHSPFGRLPEADTEALMRLVVTDALRHAETEPEAIDAVFVGVFNNGFSPQDFQAALVGVVEPALATVPATRLENACATGTAALHAACDFVEAGRGRRALVVGAEKMTGVSRERIGDILLGGSYRAEESLLGNSFADVFGHIARQYFDRYGDRSDELAMIAAKNHRNGRNNPWAHLRAADVDLDFCATVSDRNPYVAKPLRLTDCSPVSDGAAAVVICGEDLRPRVPRMISFRGRGRANDAFPLSRRDPLAFHGPAAAWEAACAAAGIERRPAEDSELDLLETHDCFTIAEVLQYEALGLAPVGQGHRLARDGVTAADGPLPVNPSGGLKAKGHPIGATGVSMHIMAALQLMNEAPGAMQVPGAGLAGVFNMGGAAVANYASVLERTR